MAEGLGFTLAPDEAFNAAEARRALLQITQAIADQQASVGQLADAVGMLARNEIVLRMSRRGKGRVYKIKTGISQSKRHKGKPLYRTHRASAPGDPPATDLGRLKNSVGYVVGRDLDGWHVDIYATALYAPYLEFGTSRMKPRPVFRPVATWISQKIPNEAKRVLATGGRTGWFNR